MSSENEYSEGDDSSQNGKNKKIKFEETNKWEKWDKMSRKKVKECQEKIFGKETNSKTRYWLLKDKKQEIVEYYKEIDEEFKKEADIKKNNHYIRNKTDAFYNGLCNLYLYGSISLRFLADYFKMCRLTLLLKMHERKIRLYQGIIKTRSKNGKEYDIIVNKIKATLFEKKADKCGGKWELKGTVYFQSPKEGKMFYNKILNLAREVEKTTLEENRLNYLKAVYENENFLKIINSDDVEIEGKKQNMEMFMTKFRGILFDFKRELILIFKSGAFLLITRADTLVTKNGKNCKIVFHQSQVFPANIGALMMARVSTKIWQKSQKMRRIPTNEAKSHLI
uniref:PH domain-containing protein n=1 Tax=Meloidogyne hapla TaxID=6305 RepID=A0A1I8BVU7_MELHA